MITDDIVDLVRAGVINGSRKSLDRGKIVASFCLGTRKLYDFIDGNPMFAFHPTEYVNDPGDHQPAEQDGGDQHRPGDRSDRPGLRRFDRNQVFLRDRRAGGFQPGRGAVAGRQGR
jgi:hypothetical protein